MSKKKWIPTKEDWARADAKEEERQRNLDVVRKAVLQKFSRLCELKYVFVFGEEPFQFRALVFFETEKDVEKCKSTGITQAIMDFVYEEIQRVGRGKREEVSIVFEFDSDENVQAKYEGSYWYRLH